MSTPTEFSVPAPEAQSLARALEGVAERQRSATPPPAFADIEVFQPYDYLCEVEHSKYSSKEVDQLRMSIRDPKYWEREALVYKEELSKMIWDQLMLKYGDNTSEADKWRKIASAYTRRLNRQGYTTKQVRKRRLLIDDQDYWKPESECVREASALAEQTSILKRRTNTRERVKVQKIARKKPTKRKRYNQHATASAAAANETNGRILSRGARGVAALATLQ